MMTSSGADQGCPHLDNHGTKPWIPGCTVIYGAWFDGARGVACPVVKRNDKDIRNGDHRTCASGRAGLLLLLHRSAVQHLTGRSAPCSDNQHEITTHGFAGRRFRLIHHSSLPWLLSSAPVAGPVHGTLPPQRSSHGPARSPLPACRYCTATIPGIFAIVSWLR